MTEKRDLFPQESGALFGFHEEGEPERVTEPDAPLSRETVEQLREQGVEIPSWRPGVRDRAAAQPDRRDGSEHDALNASSDHDALWKFRSCECGNDPKKACSECGGLRLVPIPEQFQPDYVSGASFDPDTLRLAAQTHADHHALSSSFTLKPWVVLYLLAVWEAAVEASWYQMLTTSGHPKSHHVVDRKLWEAVTGRDWCDEQHAKPGPVVDV